MVRSLLLRSFLFLGAVGLFSLAPVGASSVSGNDLLATVTCFDCIPHDVICCSTCVSPLQEHKCTIGGPGCF